MERLSLRLPHQPRRRRRGRPRASPRACAAQISGLAAGAAQRPGRHLDGADGGRLAGRGPLDAAARPRARRPVQERLAERRRPAPRSRPRSTSSRPRSSASARSAEFNGIKLLNAAVDDHLPGRRQRRRAPIGVAHDLASAPRSARPVFALSPAATTDLDEIDSAIDAVSAQRSTFGAVQNRFEHTLNGLGDLPGEPRRVRVAHPRRGHGRGDDRRSRSTRSCSRPAPRCSRRPTSCPSPSCRSCAARPSWPPPTGSPTRVARVGP